MEIVSVVAGPLLVGIVLYLPLAVVAAPALVVVFWTVFASVVATSFLMYMEIARAFRFPEPPLREELADGDLPRLACVVAAYLPNEQDTLIDSVHAHLSVDYPADRYLLVVAYNTPAEHPLEGELAALAAVDPRLVCLRVDGSSSKVENLNAALDLLVDRVDVVGIFDADHEPHPLAARRAARWLSDRAGDRRFDVVQGQCTVRNDDGGFVSALVAAEFAALYAVAHPGRTVIHDFGIFGGSNGWWRLPVLSLLRLDETMLTEDIDVSARALGLGCRLGTDPRILSAELAPTSWTSWWRQRIRWAQGWHEVSLKHARALATNTELSLQQRRGVVMLFGWRMIHPWVATQMIPVMVAMAAVPGRDIPWLLPFFVVAALFANGVPVLQAVAANRLGAPGVGGRPKLYLRFAVLSLVFYAELRMVVTRAAAVRHLLGAHAWDITRRTPPPGGYRADQPAGGPAAPSLRRHAYAARGAS